MRAGPLSDKNVIEMLNRYFVPVTSANELQEPASRQIYNDFWKRGMGIGDVHVYVVGPDGTAIGGMDIGSAMDTGKELGFLRGIVDQLKPQAGAPIFPPRAQGTPPKVESGAPAIHLVVRKDAGKISWNDFPSENWILLNRQEWDQILPPAGAKERTTWTIPQPVAVKLSEWIYPQTEDTKRVNRSRVDLADY